MFTGHPIGPLPAVLHRDVGAARASTRSSTSCCCTRPTPSAAASVGPRTVGNEVYGIYLAFVYFTPYLGGILADRFLGYRKSVLIGASGVRGRLLPARAPGRRGAFPGRPRACCACGNGLLQAEHLGDGRQPVSRRVIPKRDAGFNIFYMGINIGAFFGQLPGRLHAQRSLAWEAAFIAAGIGLLALGC